jgi:hypothetical protein
LRDENVVFARPEPREIRSIRYMSDAVSLWWIQTQGFLMLAGER